MLEEVAGTRHTTWQHNQICISVITLLKLDVSLDVHTMSRLYERKLRSAHRYNIHTTTTQYIDGNQGLDILEAVS